MTDTLLRPAAAGTAKSVADHKQAFSSWPTEDLVQLNSRLRYLLDGDACQAIAELIAERRE